MWFKMNKISFWALVLTVPFLLNCLLTHYCMCGHNAHGQLSNIADFVNDALIFLLMAISLGLSLKDKNYKLVYYLYLLFSVVLVQLLSFIGIIFYLFALYFHFKYHANDEKLNKKV